MSSMPARVTYSRPAIISAAKLPLLISLRSPEMPMLPSGKASRAAMSSRKGVVGVIVSGDGIDLIDMTP
jgi:hypothetical protein